MFLCHQKGYFRKLEEDGAHKGRMPNKDILGVLGRFMREGGKCTLHGMDRGDWN